MKKYIILLNLLIITTGLMAQKTNQDKGNSADSLLNSISSDNKNEPVVIFKSTRLILSQSTETVKKNNFNFEIIHRFGDFAGPIGGGKYFWGLDDVADVTFWFEYGLSDNLGIVLQRSTIGGMISLELKYAMVHQMSDGGSPVAITILGQQAVRPYGSFASFGDRMSNFAQVIFARKFSSDFSFEVAPSYVSNNTDYPPLPGVEDHFFALSGAARLKVTKHMGILVDYAHPFSSFITANGFSDPFGFGIEMTTGGHVFTINITNARAGSEINYMSNTQSDFSRGQYRIGFTISRMFDFNHKEVYKSKVE